MITKNATRSCFWLTLTLALVFSALGSAGTGNGGVSRASDDPHKAKPDEGRKLAHEETLKWINDNKAWRLARKTKPIWARAVTPEEVGREFQTADHVKEMAREGYWLCVGVADEPWFQAREKIEAKYEPDGEEPKKFGFDAKLRTYRKFKPKGVVRNWVAQVKGPGIEGFYVRPGYDPKRPLYSPAGGYVVKDAVKDVVKDEVADPYKDEAKDVWLVQKALFESTYELIPNPRPSKARAGRDPDS